MATREEANYEIARTLKISGFRVMAHRLLAEIDVQYGTNFLKARNDQWEKEYGSMTRKERGEEELQRAMVYVGAGKAPEHISIHIHVAHECGYDPRYILERLMKAAQWGGAAENSQTAVEAWRIIFMPNFPSVFPTKIDALSKDSIPPAEKEAQPTEPGRVWSREEKQREVERVTKISGFRVGYHEFIGEMDTDSLKARNDRWEEEHGSMTRQERMEEELQRAMVYVGCGKAAGHIAIHIHMANQCGASKEHLYKRIVKAARWGGVTEAYQTGLEAWRMVFMPDFPTVFRVAELTSDSVPAA
jgi:hypothetical protein